MKLLCCIQSLSRVWLFETSWTAAHQASLSFTISRNLLRLMSIELVMLSNDLILCCPLLLLPSVFPNIRVFFNELALHIMWPKYWSFSFSSSPFNECSGLIFRMDWLDLLPSKGLSGVSSSTTVWKHLFFSISLLYGPTLTSMRDYSFQMHKLGSEKAGEPEIKPTSTGS